MKEEIFQKIIAKKEFSELPRKDVEMAFSHFEKRQVIDEEKIRLTRELLHKAFGAFGSSKLMGTKERSHNWILKKHLSTRERLFYYGEVYKKIFSGLGKKASVIDLGAGVNGFSYPFLRELGQEGEYVSVEAVGQLVDITNKYFKKEKIKGKAVHLSLFDIGKVKEILSKAKKPRVVFLFKTLDSLEMLKKDFSKELLLQIKPFSERIVISFATQSMIKRREFYANRKWIIDFLSKNFEILDDFNIGGERYIVAKR
jgi:hypothetical protein